jgi:hypothetical protein
MSTAICGFVESVPEDGSETIQSKFGSGMSAQRLQQHLSDAAQGQVPAGCKPVIRCYGCRPGSKAATTFEVVAASIAWAA